jgi:hypothetical protein
MNSFRLTTVKNTMIIYVYSFRLCQPLLSGWVAKIVFKIISIFIVYVHHFIYIWVIDKDNYSNI